MNTIAMQAARIDALQAAVDEVTAITRLPPCWGGDGAGHWFGPRGRYLAGRIDAARDIFGILSSYGLVAG